MRTVSGMGRPCSVLSLEGKEDDGEDKAWVESFGNGVIAGGPGRWTVARDAFRIECSLVGWSVGHCISGLARSPAASRSGGRRSLAAPLRASLFRRFRLARFRDVECSRRLRTPAH